MRISVKVLGMGAACVAACALPAIIPVLGLAGVGAGLNGWLLSGAALIGLVGTVAFTKRARVKTACRVDGGCGCKQKTGQDV